MNLFQNAKFFTTVNHLKDLPDTPAEIAFVGRSNAGKSSTINTLTNHVRLAYVSKTPGRTQHINFFELSNGSFMVDLPGYGYAQVPEAIRTHWMSFDNPLGITNAVEFGTVAGRQNDGFVSSRTYSDRKSVV